MTSGISIDIKFKKPNKVFFEGVSITETFDFSKFKKYFCIVKTG